MKKVCAMQVKGIVGVCIDNINVDLDNPEGDLDFEGALEAVRELDKGELYDVELKLHKSNFRSNGGSEFEYRFTAKWEAMIDAENENGEDSQHFIDAYENAKSEGRFGDYECNEVHYSADKIYDFDDTKPIVWENTTENNLREVIVFREGGFYCGYVGIPEEMEAYKADSLEDYIHCVHGGVTYEEPYSPDKVREDISRKWVGFDCNHGCDGIYYDLTKQMYGVTFAEKAKERNLFGHMPVPFSEVYEQVQEMAKAVEQYHHLDRSDVLILDNINWKLNEHSIISLDNLPPFSVAIPFDIIENSFDGENLQDIVDDYLWEDLGIKLEAVSYEAMVNVEISFMSIVLEQQNGWMVDYLTEHRDDFPATLPVHIPMDAIESFYREQICDSRTAEFHPVVTTADVIDWLKKYTIDETKPLFSYLKEYYDDRRVSFDREGFDMNSLIIDNNENLARLESEAMQYAKENYGIDNEQDERDDI